ncbi:MAG: putative sulfate exporter family transporter [Betaproteobacteria bacterium]|nr:MAG: putative sulfate exporter family transporter [Betaproteobacteria bacterium]
MAMQKWRTEDWVAVYVGFFIIAATLAVYGWKFVDLRGTDVSFRWTTDSQIASRAPDWGTALDSIAKEAEGKGQKEIAAKANELKAAIEKSDRKAVEKAAGDLAKVGGRNTVPGSLGSEIRGHAAAVADAKVFTWDNLNKVVYIGIIWLVLGAVGFALIGGKTGAFVIGFPVVFVLAWLARVIAGNGLFIEYGVEYVIFALALGLLISNTIGTPKWLMPAVQTEYYIKTGLVVLGAGLLFMEIIQAGVLGILQAVLVVTVVWYVCFWIARKLRVDDDFAAMLSSSVAICGVSAAIATCGAIQGDKKKLSYVTSLVLIVAVPMMIVMPWLVKAFQIPDIVAGAWMGGTLDTSASVVAAGALISDAAMKTGVIVKFSQNALIGVAAFILVVWWAYKAGAAGGTDKPSAGIIWERFPKFVLGFLIASALFSFFLPGDMVKGTQSALGQFRTWWFALAFVCIGLETKFVDLATMEGGRPAVAFIAAQAVNVVWTLILAYLLFGGVIFPVPDIK